MNLERIIKLTRAILDDEIGSNSERLWKDFELVEYCNDAQRRICQECHLIEDERTINEVLATGTVTLSGGAGQIDSISVNGVVITSGAVPFNTSPTQTASDLANNINAYTSSPNYTASAALGVVTISAVAGTGSTPNGYAVVANVSGGLTGAVVDMSGGDAITRLYLVVGQSIYEINSKIVNIRRFKLLLQTKPLSRYTHEELDRDYTNWEGQDNGTPLCYIPNIKGKYVTIVPPPDTADTVKMLVSRLPLTDLAEDDIEDSPEIPEEYHMDLIDWVLHRAYSKQDSETYDEGKADKYEKRWYQRLSEIKDIERKRSGTEEVCAPHGSMT